MPASIPADILEQTRLADPAWQPLLKAALERVHENDPAYLPALARDHYLPTQGRLFAAFRQPLDAIRYVLVGEGPYPREESATGVCFMDGAVRELWSDKGLSKPVNRATSLRNFMKMLLVAEGQLKPEQTTGDALSDVAHKARTSDNVIQTLPELQANLTKHGFLLLNATLVYRAEVPPLREAKAWLPFLQTVLAALADHAAKQGKEPPTLVLWGKIAVQLEALPANSRFPKKTSEHP